MTKKILLPASLVILLLSFFTLSAQYRFDEKKGEKQFMEQCSKCHRRDGSGIKMVYPPLKNSDYIRNHDNTELLRGMLYGRSGKIVVNGYSFNGVMTTEIDKSLTSEDICDILNFVLQKLNGLQRFSNPKELKEARKEGKLPVQK